MSGLESYGEFKTKNENESLDFSRLLSSGHDQYSRGSFDQAHAIYTEALSYPHIEGHGLFELYKNLGNIELQRGDFSSAEEHYNRANVINANSDVLMVNFGSLAIMRQDLARAVQCFRRAVELNVSNSKAWAGLATIHREFGDHELSWANAERALDLEPNFQVVIQLITDWAVKDNELDRACKLIEKYKKYQPNDLSQRVILAKFYYLLGRLDQAEQESIQVLKMDPAHEDAEALFSAIRNERMARSTRFK
jgi:tetratricopeptide (TPR) repeat protein